MIKKKSEKGPAAKPDKKNPLLTEKSPDLVSDALRASLTRLQTAKQVLLALNFVLTELRDRYANKSMDDEAGHLYSRAYHKLGDCYRDVLMFSGLLDTAQAAKARGDAMRYYFNENFRITSYLSNELNNTYPSIRSVDDEASFRKELSKALAKRNIRADDALLGPDLDQHLSYCSEKKSPNEE